MKTIHLFTALALSTAMFTGCKKSSYNLTPDSSAMSASSADANSKSMVTMQSLLVISSGYTNATALGIYGNGQLLYRAGQPVRLDLFKPLADQGISLTSGYYNNLQLTMKTEGRSGTSGLYLKGVVRIDDDIFVPVQILIDAPADIRAFPKVQYLQPGTTMFGMMNLVANKIGVGITQQMWEQARSSTDPMITISATQNPELYRIVLANLGTMMHIGFSGTNVATTSNNSVM